MKIPVHKIQPCFTIPVVEFVNDSYPTSNAAILLHFMLIMQIYFVAQVEPAIILEVSNLAEISCSFSSISTCL